MPDILGKGEARKVRRAIAAVPLTPEQRGRLADVLARANEPPRGPDARLPGVAEAAGRRLNRLI